MTVVKKESRTEVQEELLPVRIVKSSLVENVEGLLTNSNEEISFSPIPYSVTFKPSNWTGFQGKGSFVILDFGKELCGGIRIITRNCVNTTRWRVTFGESLTEACSAVGEQNATNDHSPRDFEVLTSNMSDLSYGATGFRFVRMELLDDTLVSIQQILAVSHLPYFESEAEIRTNDTRLNDIINTAVYTLKLCFQKGYIWDGIKRDRLVWGGDLHPEIVTSLYLFGDTENITNSLRLLRDSTAPDKWINDIPTYSAWWVINLCDYYSFTGNKDFFEEGREYALHVLQQLDNCISEDGKMTFKDAFGMDYFLDWPSNHHPDAVAGTAALLCWMARKFLAMEENDNCRSLLRKLAPYLEERTTLKNIRAFQILAGKTITEEDAELLQKDGAKGISTFMSYYDLTAMAQAGGKDMLEIVKTYYGGMLDHGATTFWEDFDIDWLENSSRIDEFPKEGQRDIHGDFGKYCYKQLRHSLCHGWSCGVLAFLIEYVFGIHITEGGRNLSVKPHLMGLSDVKVKLPLKDGEVVVTIHDDEVEVQAPEGVNVEL